MPIQGNLFGGVGQPIGSSLFDPISAAAGTGAMSPAQRSAMVFMQSQPKSFAVPQPAYGPQQQMSLNFAGSSRKMGAAGKFLKGARGAAKGILTVPGAILEAGIIAGITIAGTIEGSAQWGAPTGLQEDYVGGAVYGATKGFGTGVGGALGGFGGLTLGAGVGSMIFPGVGTVVGGLVGAVAGSIGGEMALGSLAQGPARQLGMGARAIVRTARAVDTVQFGGNFVDSRAAYTMRQRAVSDMSGSMMNARQFLGNEAIFLHER